MNENVIEADAISIRFFFIQQRFLPETQHEMIQSSVLFFSSLHWVVYLRAHNVQEKLFVNEGKQSNRLPIITATNTSQPNKKQRNKGANVCSEYRLPLWSSSKSLG